jgi:drug/metabolite transporter (DMT)-like permease
MTGSLRTNAIGLGIVFILLSSVIFAPLTQTATKFLAGDFPVFQIILFRSIGHAFWMLLFFLPQHGVSMLRANRPWLHLARSALLFGSTMLWISAVSAVPLATAGAINFTAPVFVVILSIPMLREKVGLHRWAAVFLGFTGALIVIQPGSGGFQIEYLLLLGAAFLFAIYQILTRLAAGSDSEATSSFYTVLVGLVVGLLVAPWNYVPPASGDWVAWGAFAAIGLLGGIRHYLVVKAYARAPASVVSPFFYCELVGVTLLGFLVFGDIPPSTTWAGAALIILCGLYIAHRERLKKPG